jgi:hypothetical protein
MSDFTTPKGRIVAGHPMIISGKTDSRTAQPKLNKTTGLQLMETYFALAIPKAGEQHWNQTAWGAQVWNDGATAFPKGEYNAPTFAWKIIDGDSSIPNKKGKVPNQQEGWAGSWVIHFSTSIPVQNYKLVGTVLSALTSDKEVKRGDYGRVSVSCKGNGSTESPGVYLNPTMFCLDDIGVAIIGESADPSAAFGGTLAQAAAFAPAMAQPMVQPPVAMVQPPVAVTPAPAFLNGPAPMVPVAPRMVMFQGQAYDVATLIAGGWTEAQVQAQTTPVA